MIGENVRTAWGPETLFPAFPSESPSFMSRRTFPEEAEDSETARIILVFEIHF